MTDSLPTWDAPHSAYEKWLRDHAVKPIAPTPPERPDYVTVDAQGIRTAYYFKTKENS